MADFHEMAEYLRSMGETEKSIAYLTSQREPSLLEIFGDALRPTTLENDECAPD